jgi:hypothetical protein
LRFESRRAPAKLRRHLRNPLLVPSVLAGLAALVLGLLWLQSGRTRQSLQSQVATAAGRIATLEAGMAATEASRATTRRVAGFDSAPATGAGAAVLTTHRSRLASVGSVGPLERVGRHQLWCQPWRAARAAPLHPAWNRNARHGSYQ